MSFRALPRRRPSVPVRAALIVVLGLLGGWLGLTVAGTVHHELGPLTTSMQVRPAWGGGTVVSVPPLGELELDTHGGPLGLRAALEGIDVEEARVLVQQPELIGGLQEDLTQDLAWELRMALLRALLAAGVGAGLLAALGLRRVRDGALAAGSTTLAVLGSVGVAVGTWNPAALAEPRYTGLLASAPSVVGSADRIVSEFSVYGDQLAGVVRNVSGLYLATSDLPLLAPEEDLVRVLHVSDLHLAPQAWDVVRTVTEQYGVDVVVDSGDITDHGSRPENRYLAEVRHLPVPYVWVRGNHDSATTERAMRELANVVVLDGRVRTVRGLRFLGAGDPTFTPDKADTAGPEDVAAAAADLAATAEAAGGVDVMVYHDPTPSAVFEGHASMALSGHLHYRRVRQGPEHTWHMVQGSTGGSGLRALEPEEPAAIMLSVLYVDRETGALQAYDDIRLGGLGLASAQVTREVVAPPATELVAPQPD